MVSLLSAGRGNLSNNMTERQPFQFKKTKEEEVVHYLPPAWCGAICRNAMNEVCVENCAIKRDCSAFEPKPDLKLSEMPRFPLKESARMTKEEKFTSVTVYLAKVVDHLKGIEDESGFVIYPRASRTVSIEKAVAEIAADLKDYPADSETDETVHQPTATNNNTNKENE